ncbi:MAG: cytochrome d ubiquinol oxidase subunit II [Chlamydiae bacterium CG10_big_fil_rev_8_21_14_0_10_35_9]|nr:MAG: cytochrome d ubiquinol oxidase subunit II [Chlamydiae bacterium CG10_big_fil_rev_8_21_14_0_10_35_9]
MEGSIWEVLWYFVIGTSIVMYTILDGFDLGVGILHLFGKSDQDRRIFLNAIGPVWDGNEVWLVVIIGGLFAGFPGAYASLFSGFYSLFMIFIAVIILRAVAIEFRSKREGKAWRLFWDIVFSFASICFAFTLGLTFGNILQGIPLNSSFEYEGAFSHFFRPYPVLIGFTAIAILSMHGATFLFMKTEGELHKNLKRWVMPTIIVFAVLYILTTITTINYLPYMTQNLKEYPILFVFPAIALLAIASIPLFVKRDRDGYAFIASSLAITFLLVTAFSGIYPNLIRSSINPVENSVTLMNSSSSDFTLKILLTIAAIGVPLVLSYGIWVYHIFRGKVTLDHTSY